MPPEDQELAAVDTSFTHLDAGDYELFLEAEGLTPERASPPRSSTPPSARVPWIPILLILLLAAAALVLGT
jgi:hypothetical protein